jgi:hypothetical protein
MPNPCCFTPDPTGKWLFVGSFLTPGIMGFHIESSGALTPVAEPALANRPLGIAAFDSSGKYLYISDANGVVSGFQLDQNRGILTPLP